MRAKLLLPHLALAAFVLAGAHPLFGATHFVETIGALQATLRDAQPGDTIILKDGVYTTTGPISVRRAGAAGQPIVIAAETIGGVEIAGTHGFNVAEPAAHVVISGFKFMHVSGRNSIGAGTTHVRFTRNTFLCTGEGAYLNVAGDDAQIDYNEFGAKKTSGSMLAVGGTGSQVARRVWIHHNYFHDLTTTGATVAEMIRFGLTALSLSTGAGVVEHNLLARCRGDNELISSRASGITYRYNALLDSPTAQFSLRHGNECIVHSNTLRNTEGLRVFGDRHLVFSNYLEGNYMGINVGNGSGEVADGAPLTSHDRPDGCVIAFNTLVDNRTHYQMSRRTPEALGATDTTFANNVLQGGSYGVKIEGPYARGVWLGNILWKTPHPGDLPADGFVSEDPLLAPDEQGIQRPQPGSIAVGAALGNFPNVVVDLDGQPRPEKRSIGADDVSSEPASARVLTESDVGPNAK